jgi:hypothetical protein
MHILFGSKPDALTDASDLTMIILGRMLKEK